MRFDTLIYLVQSQGDVYNDETGNHDEGEPIKTEVYCSLADTSAEMAQIMYGKLKVGAYTLILQGLPPVSADHIEYDGKKYSIDRIRRHRTTTTYWISGGV